MKTVVRPMVALAALSACAMAQDIVGSWQGTLQVGRDLRLVFKISDPTKVIVYNIDQSGQSVAGNVTLQAPSVKITIPGIGAAYEGKLSTDNNSIAGTFTQGGQPLPLILKRATPETAWAIPEPPARLPPMRADIAPAFEVATIKPSKPDATGHAFRVQGRHFSAFNTTPSEMVTFAYGIHAKQVVGAPSWMDSERYDIDAEPDAPGQPSEKQWKTMLQKLLADRFKLAFHRDKKELSVYALIVGKGGPKLTKSEGDPNGLPALFFRGFGNLPARNATMADLASVMQAVVLDRPVVDQTGIAGRWDFTLTWTKDDDPDVFTAVQQQLGLKFESTKAPADVLVIDKVEKPSEN